MKNNSVSSGEDSGNTVDNASSYVNGVNEKTQESNRLSATEGSLGSIETPFGAFTKDGKYVVVMSPNGNLSLFQTNIDTLVSENAAGTSTDTRTLEFKSRIPLQSEQRKKTELKQNKQDAVAQLTSGKAGKVTCLAISYQPLPNEKSKTVKRRKQIPESNEALDIIIAIGFHLGEVLLRKSGGFSDLEVFHGCPESIQAHNKRQVSGICFSQDASKMFSSGHDGNIVIWERSSFSSPPYPKRRIVHGASQSISCIACNKAGTRLAVGDTEISLYDVEKGSKILYFRGHRNPISGLSFFLEDNFLVSCSVHENNAYIWSCNEESQKLNSANEVGGSEVNQRSYPELNGQVESKKAWKRTRPSDDVHMPRTVSGVLRSNFPVKFVNVLSEDWKKKCCLLTCILADGTVSGYELSVQQLEKENEAAFSLESPSFTTVTSTSDDAIFTTAMDSTHTFVLFGHGGFLKPIIEAVSLSEIQREASFRLKPKQKGGILRVNNAFSHLNEASNRLVKHLREEKESEVLSNKQLSVASQAVLKNASEDMNNTVKDGAAEVADSEEEQTLEAKLNHLNVSETLLESAPPKKFEKQAERPRRNLETSIRILEQAVGHHDTKLLERALASVTDKRQIQRTVGRLDSSCVVPLLRELILRFESNPNRAKVLLVWIQSVLIRHASFLSSTGELVDELKRLQEVMEERMDVFQSILELEGRLELITSHFKTNLEDQNSEQPMFEYDEEDSEASNASDAAINE
ncbi:WD repeat-containing protein 43 [Galdieria sulphuraria]|uniref:Nucleic acid binding protein n=1 Tax=Galdieria sulphuraria TaxID=130081 RepID=M2Y4X5_GALSU|nr:nucleic acid binding protein [Galdieria sulphuraria]EME30899.1 nucleic acid binding protein [Galdieria sulphuraria]GJD08156.1 WD repeat-containing protein 43 [Galdieria sulphuraria]|eukprot:XP_005707419.1 nucleic acid binding protein [Galdieria sulphuraria]